MHSLELEVARCGLWLASMSSIARVPGSHTHVASRPPSTRLYRETHHISGRAVQMAEERNCPLTELTLADLQVSLSRAIHGSERGVQRALGRAIEHA
eukprot:scaffold230398_cov35-Tisochrysis_lutea.AAC.4